VFSRTERQLLTLLIEGPAATAQQRLESAFPNPTYRRKLLWGIRRKVGHSWSDWHLYAEAVRRDERLLPRAPESVRPASPPLYTEPMVVFLSRLRRAWPGRRKKGARPGAHEEGP
jgi:hypothetical protein